tara:strand:- start:1336 stop:1917 length:582 start_codon:yes stop_codon:yes gene_type:complete
MDSTYKNQKVAVNNFVKRQTEGSGKSYSSYLTFEQIAKHAEEQLHKGQFSKGYREGVLIVDSNPSYVKYFKCPFVKIDKNTILKAEWICRRSDEEPYIQIRALNGSPLKAGKVVFILYHHDVLDETSEQTTNADWELISIHALPEGIEKLPMGPVTMMRNQLELKGGTAAHYPSDKWAESVQFWQKYAPLLTE